MSHTIRRLEERLGVRLINRTTRSMALTEAGLALYTRVATALDELDRAEESATSFLDSAVGTLRINVPSLAAFLLFDRGLGEFTREFPGINLEIVVDDDFSDVVADGFDAGIRLGHRVHRDMIAVRVTPDLRLAIAA